MDLVAGVCNAPNVFLVPFNLVLTATADLSPLLAKASACQDNIFMPTKKEPPSIFQLNITLIGIEPPIWRRIQVPSTIRLSSLHEAIQIAMGWANKHGHEFQDDRSRKDQMFDNLNENRVQLGTVLKGVDDSMIYVYDFGDNWRHHVRLGKILPMDETSRGHPICLAGERRCPPEDVGGINGYDELMEAIFDPDPRESYEQFSAWTNGTFQPNEFDLRIVNEKLSALR